MEFDVLAIFLFIVLTFVYGSNNAVITQGLKYFEPGVLMLFRYVFALSFSLIVLIIRYIFNHNDLKTVMWKYFKTEKMKIAYLLLGGIFSMGIPASLISTGQKWVSSASVQLMNPIATASGAVFSHFYLADEKFTSSKLYSLISAVIGVGFTSIPMFNHANSNPNVGFQSMLIGFIMVLVGIIISGLYPGLLKLKVSDVDISISIVFQLLTALIYFIVWSFVLYDWNSIRAPFSYPIKYWFSPFVLGTVMSGLCFHGYIFLIGKIGSFGVNLMPFGQLIVGVGIGVFFLNEWKGYLSYEYVISLFGMILLCLSLWIGLNEEKKVDEKAENASDDGSIVEEL